jgi:regulator of protease activity HflC (stomatin/prohibitin superfamily)
METPDHEPVRGFRGFGRSRGRSGGAVPAARVLRFVRLALIAVPLLLIAACSVVTVETGHVGVTTLFGKLSGPPLPEGIHVINPLLRVHRMSVRTQERKEHAEVPSSEGLIIALEASLLYRVDPTQAPAVYQKIGPEFVEVIVAPNFRSVMRAVTAAHTANDLYSEGRELIAQQMLAQMKAVVEPRGVLIENVLLRDIGLPGTLKAAIEAKQQAEQDAQRMQFVLQKEKQEAERKRIEAQGVSDFQRIVSQGISPALLEWKGIEATEKLVGSPNSKIVIIGNPKNGLPLIFPGQ